MTQIEVNKIFHLHNFAINITDDHKKHLILTGKNGAGKTVLLKAIFEFLVMIAKDKALTFRDYESYLESDRKYLAQLKQSGQDTVQVKGRINNYQQRIETAFGKVRLHFNDLIALSESFHKGEFLMAYYAAERDTQMLEPRNPQKPDLKQTDITQNKTQQFLYFLSDYKIQEALARNENQLDAANEIAQWFVDFESLLRELFEDEHLKLAFNYKDYSFRIESQAKSFKFTELSAGYSAVLNIVTDLVLKMQKGDTLVRTYNKPGIVLIDEIETHLHLELQRMVLPLLARVFPKVQFIITTHSPFVLNSLENVTAFDLESKETITDLTDYSYEALAEGYFGVKTESGIVTTRIKRLEELIALSTLKATEQIELKELISDFEKAPELAAPNIKAAYQMLKLQLREKGLL